MIPTSLGFLDRLPRTASGKTDRAALLAQLPSPGVTAGTFQDRTLTKAVTDVWREVLAAGDLTEHDDVFDRGPSPSRPSRQQTAWRPSWAGR